ncbi:hypothetical protein MOV66_32905 [Agrobacterium sp. SHOUNA12C]|uniref:Uncharacterized protein n=1 Tax=Rhizobium rhizogenes NBRC 13257 TaxID=1220581 RepID=A0AA87PZ59_RHIRH|nr:MULTISPECIES: hypothetical protein [Rhizobium]MCJ9723839.1 hypothetical protein [Agrobacterium sp. BETTINA12B]MCJ9761471.1 hypothetical protein [Agrobacterium sp. SHOUNA12C]EJK86022.1 hypothetical protein PMI03_01895 [Rhizobium sp. AP16]MDJ1637522.1 hypothetical protein [Rhizobium rhizogenes]NTF50256.1 hypothetical protein [Rhizobium rhizogenes]
MIAIIAGTAALALVGTSFVVLIYASRVRDREMRRMVFKPVILEFKPRQQRSGNSGRN